MTPLTTQPCVVSPNVQLLCWSHKTIAKDSFSPPCQAHQWLSTTGLGRKLADKKKPRRTKISKNVLILLFGSPRDAINGINPEL